MERKKIVKDPQEAFEAICKLLSDEAANLIKIRNYTKALAAYGKVRIYSQLQIVSKYYK